MAMHQILLRTYAYSRNKFGELIARMDQLMLNAVDGLQPGKSYVDLHIKTYNEIAEVSSRSLIS